MYLVSYADQCYGNAMGGPSFCFLRERLKIKIRGLGGKVLSESFAAQG